MIPDEIRLIMCSTCLPKLEEILRRAEAAPNPDPWWTPKTLEQYWGLLDRLIFCRQCTSRMKGWKELPRP